MTTWRPSTGTTNIRAVQLAPSPSPTSVTPGIGPKDNSSLPVRTSSWVAARPPTWTAFWAVTVSPGRLAIHAAEIGRRIDQRPGFGRVVDRVHAHDIHLDPGPSEFDAEPARKIDSDRRRGTWNRVRSCARPRDRW